ncbi:5-formyltetrahydrofolate cyclo-ligase [Paracnuella aquatica]|uniref:5-formyltetrahydrofolate cyclo-ligase n=1 Tax=Paracnuella aquatica TaxID=2268757 RepID=UPI0013905EBB|nr:5-formyltetrahydrofolate cyclo-ligase [Paracnuella aquatica]
MAVTMRKKEARAHFRAQRAAVTDVQKTKWDDLLLIQLQQLHLPFLNHVLSYYPADEKGEAETFFITDFLRFQNPGVEVAYPRIEGDGLMHAVVPQSEDDFVPNAYQILEPVGDHIIQPEQIELVLVPLLCFDEQGNRVGYGKGYYDRFLQQCNSDCLKVGLSYFEPIAQIEDASEYDVPLNLCITPQKVYVF